MPIRMTGDPQYENRTILMRARVAAVAARSVGRSFLLPEFAGLVGVATIVAFDKNK